VSNLLFLAAADYESSQEAGTRFSLFFVVVVPCRRRRSLFPSKKWVVRLAFGVVSSDT
jgi:hypothetical protein